ncbi:MAG: hypothetical protein BIFFINMI_03734 [Phycisphaerae bacterium]|nr:hypothetical protein [Phycisphaerae bacterium]
MNICFSTLACPEWDLQSILAHAAEFGYDGVDFYNLGGETDLPAQPAFSTEAARTREQFAAAGLAVVALSCSAAFDQARKRKAAAAMDQARRYMDAAAAVGARFVRVLATEQAETGDEPARLARAADRLGELADHATDVGVRLVVENVGSFARCESMWWLMERVANPRVGVCWNPVAGLDAVQKPSKVIPTLGSRIHYVKVRNVKVGGDNAFRYAPLDAGDLNFKHAIELLRGVGYDGFLCFELERLWNLRLAEQGATLGPLPAPQDALAKAAQLLHTWLGQPAEASAG